MNLMKPGYSSLHDPHLRKYYLRKDRQSLLRRRDLITPEKEPRNAMPKSHILLPRSALRTTASPQPADHAELRHPAQEADTGPRPRPGGTGIQKISYPGVGCVEGRNVGG
ncbi:hypothetical protein COCON_G00039960 [Conger conger]|uniref:Uncharacterized protein n=1 Tax=Conger conger TaxID=82655 RepID=A0A9Q1E0D3_CONCO|nr:hypothetical protein COCON_G00039960 [Conger conger]